MAFFHSPPRSAKLVSLALTHPLKKFDILWVAFNSCMHPILKTYVSFFRSHIENIDRLRDFQRFCFPPPPPKKKKPTKKNTESFSFDPNVYIVVNSWRAISGQDCFQIFTDQYERYKCVFENKSVNCGRKSSGERYFRSYAAAWEVANRCRAWKKKDRLVLDFVLVLSVANGIR